MERRYRLLISDYFGDNVHVHFACKATDAFLYNASFQLACLRYVPKLVNEEDIDLLHFGHHIGAFCWSSKD